MAKQVKWRRGNTAQHSTFVGALGEITVNTDTWTLHVHDGATVGGYPITGGADTGNIGFSNVNIYSLDGLSLNNSDGEHGATAYLNLPANGTGTVSLLNYYGPFTITTGTDPGNTKAWTFTTGGNITFPDGTTQSTAWTGNLASITNSINTLTSNAASQSAELASLVANAASQAGELSTLLANAAVQAGQIGSLAGGNYGNSNVATYLSTYGGNISVGNVIFPDLSVQTTAYTGTQWRSNLQSNLQNKPSWLSYVPGGKNQEGVQYGFDATGMFFTSSADNDFAYPIQSSLHFHEQDVLEVTATIYFGATGDDHGLSIFSADTRPIWRSATDASRIAFQYTAGIPVLYGQTTANTAPGAPVLSAGNYYTIKFRYDPGNTVVVETFSGNTATGSPIDSRSINEVLPAGDYKVGFDADNDTVSVKSHWTNLTVRTLTNTVVNDLEVQGQVTGNLIPSANVTYSLGNVAYQWKDLWVSNNTIYINSVPLSIDAGGNLLINGAPVSGGAASTADITFANTSISAADDSEITVDAKTAERIRAKLRLEPTSGDAYLEAWSGQNTRSDTTWATAVWENNMYGNPYMTFTGAFDLAFFVVDTLQGSADPDTVSYSINGGPYIAWDGGSSADTSTGYVQIYTSGVNPNVSPTAITSLDWRYAYKSSMGISHGSGEIQITGRNQYLQVDIDQYILVNSKGSIEFNNSNYGNNVDIELRSGDDILLQAKDKTTSDSEGGDINIYAGDGGDADAGDSAGGGGDITIRAGDGGAPSAAYNGGLGGTLDLYGGTGGDADPGNNRSARDGGRARLQAGSAGSNNGNVALGAEGGPVEITAGQTTLTDTNGGPVIITSGQAGANALAGYVEINIPGSDIGPGGSWYFTGTGRTLEAPQDGEIWQPNAGNLSVASAGNVFVRSYDGDQHEWQFGHNGDLTIPGNITMGPGSGRLISVVTPAPGIVNWEFGMDGNLTVPGNINHANGVNILSGLGSADFSNVSLIGTPGNLTIRAPAANTITTVTHEGGGAGYGVNTITGGLAGSPGFALIQPGWTVTGNNLVGTTTVISKTIDGYGTYTITTDTTEVDPFWTYDVYTFTSNTPSYSNLVISSGNIVSGNSRVNFIANSSGDGNGYSTIELRPDADLNTDQYIIVDPTGGEPGHIHLRAGGPQDGSSADLFLGGELTFVRVSDTSGHVTVRTTNIGDPNITLDWRFENDGNLYFPGIGNNRIGESEPGLVASSDNSVVLQSNNGGVSNEWFFGSNGRLQLPSLGEDSSEIYTTEGGISIKSPAYTELRYSSTDPANVSPTSNVDGFIWITNDGAHIQNYHGGEFNREWIFGTNGNLSLPGSITFPDTTVQTTAWTGTVAYGNTIAIGYQTGNTLQGNNAVAIGSTAGQTSQGAKAIGIGEVAGRLNQGIESIGLGAGAGEQNQGAYAIAIGSTTAYLNQGTGAVAIGTSAGALYQGEHAIAIGTGAGAGLQGNNSIILNATGSTLDQTTDDTFTVKPIRAASAGNVLYYDPSSGEVTYSTNSGGSGSVLEETFESKTTATGNVTHDCTTNRLFYHTSITNNFTANFTNLGLAANEATSISLVLVQGATARMATGVQISGAAQTITWQGSASAPSGNANRTDVVTFSILCTATDTYTVLGMLTSFGG